jgi:hypothetical protein
VSDSTPRPKAGDIVIPPGGVEALAVLAPYAERLEVLLACLGRVGAQLRWLANDQSLPRKVRYTLWSLGLDIDETMAGEADTSLEPPDDDLVDLNHIPAPF